MPIYEVQDTATGKTFELEGDSPPTEQELNDIFKTVGGGSEPTENSESMSQKVAGYAGKAAEAAGALGIPGMSAVGDAASLMRRNPEVVKKGLEVANIPAKTIAKGYKEMGVPEGAADFVGDMYTPEALALMGVGPELATPIVKASSMAKEFAAKNMPKVSQALTGVAKKYYERIARNPKNLLPKFMGGPAGKEAAGEAVGVAEEKALGKAALATIEEINDPALSVAREKAINAAKILEQAKTMQNPAAVDAILSKPEIGSEILKGARGTQAMLDSPAVRGKQKALLEKQLDEFQEVLSKYFPDIQKARGDYAHSIARSETTRILPVLKSGDPSYMRMVLSFLGRGAGIPLGYNVPVVNAAANALAPLSLDLLQKMAQIPAVRNLALTEIARRTNAPSR